MTSGLIFVFGLFAAALTNAAEVHWTYEEAEHWKDYFPICGSATQSPIDFVPEEVAWDNTVAPFVFEKYDQTVDLTAFDLVNNGHSVQMAITNTAATDGTTPFLIHGGGLPSTYNLAQFHFHWGLTSDRGSEHTIEDAGYAAEVHLVHWDHTKYPSLSVAANSTDGLAVLGIFIQPSGSTPNPVFDSFLQHFDAIQFKEGEAPNVQKFPLAQLLPANTRDFYRYRGSLTTPPCYNSVVWTVFRQPIIVTEEQMTAFRTRIFEELATEELRTPLVNNYREPQGINGRLVFKTFEKIEWEYEGENGVANWKLIYPRCNGLKQSPIDIQTASATAQTYAAFNLSAYHSDVVLTLKNTGNYVELLASGTGTIISGGGLTGDYIFAKIILHWGASDASGSDHHVNGLAYPLEAQLVHYASKYPSLAEASKYEDGLAVLAVFLHATPFDNEALDYAWSKLSSVANADQQVTLSAHKLFHWIPTNTNSFYRYQGSLTIPGCNEAATWTVFSNTVAISERQLNQLRTTVKNVHGVPLVNNFRPVQSLNARTITKAT